MKKTHASLGTIGRRPTVEKEDSASLSDSFEAEKQATHEEDDQDSVIGSSYATEPLYLLSIGELVECLRTIEKIRGTSCCPSTVTKEPEDANSNMDSGLAGTSKISLCHSHGFRCRRLQTFIHAAKRVLWLHAKNVRIETVFSNFVELSNAVDKVTEEEYEKVYYTAAGGEHTGHDSCVFLSMLSAAPIYSTPSSEKTKISCVRNICEGLRQGLSLISRTQALLHKDLGSWVDLDAFMQDPFQQHFQSLLLMSVLIAASHLVNAGLFLLTQSELTRYTHNDLWEITRGMEELSILEEIVQEEMDIQRQQEIRHLLLCFSSQSDTIRWDSSQLYSTLSRASLLADPVDKLRPASVGHIIYLLAKYRSQVLARYLSYLILQSPIDGHYEESVCSIIARESVRCEYEFCSNFLDVTSQSTELLRNLRRLQHLAPLSAVEKGGSSLRSILSNHSKTRKKSTSEPLEEVSVAPAAKPSVSNEVVYASTTAKRSPAEGSSTCGSLAAIGGKCVPFSKMESLDNFISSFMLQTPPGNMKATQEISKNRTSRSERQTGSHMQLDDEAAGVPSSRKRLIQWSDYCEVSLRHQVVGRYLQLVWTGASSHFDANFQSVCPSVKCKWQTEEELSNWSSEKPNGIALNVVKTWPLLSARGIWEMSKTLRNLKDIEKLPGDLRRGLLRQADLLHSASHRLSWDSWVNTCKNGVTTCNQYPFASSEEQAGFYTFLEDEVFCALENLRKQAYSAFKEVKNRLPQKFWTRTDKLCPMDVNETDAGKITSFRQLRFTLTRCFTSLEVFIGQRLIVNLPKPEACESEDLVQAFSACCELRDCISLAFLLHQILLAQEEANKAESMSADSSLNESDKSTLLTSMASARSEYFLINRFRSRLCQDSLVLRKLVLSVVTSQENLSFNEFDNIPSLLNTLDIILLLFVNNWVPVSKVRSISETETSEHGRSETSAELDILVSSNAISICMQSIIKILFLEVGRQLNQARSRLSNEEMQGLHEKLMLCLDRLADLPSAKETKNLLEHFHGFTEHFQQTFVQAADSTVSVPHSHLKSCDVHRASTSTVPIVYPREPKTGSASSSASLGPIQTMAKVRKYLTSSVSRNITHTSVVSRLETLSLNMKSYFTNEDLSTKSPRHC
uniref:Uncharacterized protein n=1 Tax=Schistocephalus solidus TaxID=70667 RepID=A0A0X3NML1_SCHSO